MSDMERKLKKIIAYERHFAYGLAAHILEKPRMNLWMVLIPFIILLHMYRFQKFIVARNKFAVNFLSVRQWALSEAGRIVNDGKKRDIRAVSLQATMPESAREAHMGLIETLVDHYIRLLKAEGDDMDSLIRNAYGSRTGYMLYMNELSRVENRFNAAVEPHLSREYKEIKETISRIEQTSKLMRKEEAGRVFP